MKLEGMEPWRLGFCLSAYNAKTDREAEAAAIADRQNLKKGATVFHFRE